MVDDIINIIADRFNNVNNISTNIIDDHIIVRGYDDTSIIRSYYICSVYTNNDNIVIYFNACKIFNVNYDEFDDVDVFVGFVLLKQFYEK